MRGFGTARHLRFSCDLPRLRFLPHRLALWRGGCGEYRGWWLRLEQLQWCSCVAFIEFVVIRRELYGVVLTGLDRPTSVAACRP